MDIKRFRHNVRNGHSRIQGRIGILENHCGFFAEFPSWFKLDEWLPSVFAPTGICGDASWDFAGLTMVQWIIIIFICNAVTAGLWVLLSCLPYRIYRKILAGKEGEKAGAE